MHFSKLSPGTDWRPRDGSWTGHHWIPVAASKYASCRFWLSVSGKDVLHLQLWTCLDWCNNSTVAKWSNLSLYNVLCLRRFVSSYIFGGSGNPRGEPRPTNCWTKTTCSNTSVQWLSFFANTFEDWLGELSYRQQRGPAEPVQLGFDDKKGECTLSFSALSNKCHRHNMWVSF